MKRERYPFAASAHGLWNQCLLLANKYELDLKSEFRFHPTRKWRADIAFVDSGSSASQPTGLKILCEYHGGVYMQRKGGHQTARGARNDWAKANEAQLLGYIYLQFGPEETRTGEAMNVIERAIESREKEK